VPAVAGGAWVPGVGGEAVEAAAEQRPGESGGGTPDPTSPLPWSASGKPNPTSPPSPSMNGMPDPTSPPSPSASRMSDPTPQLPHAGLRGCDAGSHPAAAGLHERDDGFVAPCPRPPRFVCHPSSPLLFILPRFQF